MIKTEDETITITTETKIYVFAEFPNVSKEQDSGIDRRVKKTNREECIGFELTKEAPLNITFHGNYVRFVQKDSEHVIIKTIPTTIPISIYSLKDEQSD